jgi:preprotein translocase subunit YajC
VWVDIAYAQGTGAGGGALGQLSPIFLFLPLMLIFYFMIIRPQQKQRREQQAMLDNLKEGDRVVTRGGITGQIDKVEKDRGTIRIEVGTGVKLRVKREYVDQVIPN